jgi:superfamily I DNA/RNA helicase
MRRQSSQGALPGFEPPSIIKVPTAEQTTIINEIRSGTRHVLVEALAGTGKTSTILKSLEGSAVKRVLLCAFGHKNAADLRAKMPKAPPKHTWKASTLHGQGFGILRSYGWQPAVDDKEEGIHGDESENLVNDVADAIAKIVSAEELHGHELWFSHLPTAAVGTVKYMISNEVRRAARDLLIYWKDRCLGQDDVDSEDLEAFDDLGSEEDVDLVYTIAHYAYLAGARIDRPKIEQRDMIWLPLVLDLVPKWSYDLVIVDEGQDLSRPQFKLAQRLMSPGAKLVVVGDLRQSIYGWRGAVGDEVWEAMGAMKAVMLPLTVSFRCARAVVEVANVLVSDLRACDDAPAGVIHTCTFERMIEGLPTTTIDSFVLSRNNAVLFDIALQLWSRNAIFSFSKGKELAAGLHALVNQLNINDAESFRKSLDEWCERTLAKAEEKSAISKIARIKQRRATLLALLRCTEPKGLHALLQRLTTERDSAVVKLATVHGAKGLEADRVYLMRETFARHQERPPEPIPPEELNLEYVAITRARHELVWVDLSKLEILRASR